MWFGNEEFGLGHLCTVVQWAVKEIGVHCSYNLK